MDPGGGCPAVAIGLSESRCSSPCSWQGKVDLQCLAGLGLGPCRSETRSEARSAFHPAWVYGTAGYRCPPSFPASPEPTLVRKMVKHQTQKLGKGSRFPSPPAGPISICLKTLFFS